MCSFEVTDRKCERAEPNRDLSVTHNDSTSDWLSEQSVQVLVEQLNYF